MPLSEWDFSSFCGIEPYRMGALALSHAFACSNETPLFFRVSQCFVGTILLVPILNTIALAVIHWLGFSFVDLRLPERVVRTLETFRIAHHSKEGVLRSIVRDQVPAPDSLKGPLFQYQTFQGERGVMQDQLDALEYWIEPDYMEAVRRSRTALEAARVQQLRYRDLRDRHFLDKIRHLGHAEPRQFLGTFQETIIDGEIPQEATQKDISIEFRTRKKAGVALTQGVKTVMQDTYLVDDISFDAAGHRYNGVITAVFDGHGPEGEVCATYMATHLLSHLRGRIEAFCPDEVNLRGLWNSKIAFVDVSRSYTGQGGSTANACLELGKALYCYNVGDARALIVTSQGDVIQISEDARLELLEGAFPNAYIRGTQRRGNSVSQVRDKWRIEKSLEPPRTLGDHRFDNSARPKVTRITREEIEQILDRPLPEGEELYLIQGSDGLFDVANSDHIGAFAHQLLQLGLTPAQVSARLVQAALRAGSSDNITALVKKLFI